MTTMKKSFAQLLIAILAGFIVWWVTENWTQLPEYKKTISNITDTAAFDSFIRKNTDKIVFLNMLLERGQYVTINEDNPSERGFSTVTDCDAEALAELRAGKELSHPTACSVSDFLFKGNTNDYIFGREHFYYIVKGNYYVEYLGAGQGTTVFNLKAIAPGSLATFINKRR